MDRNMSRFMSKDDYKAAGARHQRDPEKNPTTYRKGVDKSWQSKAFFEGADAEKAKLSSGKLHHETQDGIKPECMSANTAGWPEAAAEHAKRLVADLAKERSTMRRARLYRAITRMQKRHGHLTA